LFVKDGGVILIRGIDIGVLVKITLTYGRNHDNIMIEPFGNISITNLMTLLRSDNRTFI